MNLISAFISDRESGRNLITSERATELDELSKLICHQIESHDHCDVTIICTHNSRRSQLAEFLLRLAAHHYDVDNIHLFSGGTEATAFNHRMVWALEHFGFDLEKSGDVSNPDYQYKSAGPSLSQKMFSKVYDHVSNPQRDFIAIMVCDHVDQNCPIVNGAAHRFSLPYLDPKAADDSPKEARVYLDKVKEVGREMVYLVDQIASNLNE